MDIIRLSFLLLALVFSSSCKEERRGSYIDFVNYEKYAVDANLYVNEKGEIIPKIIKFDPKMPVHLREKKYLRMRSRLTRNILDQESCWISRQGKTVDVNLVIVAYEPYIIGKYMFGENPIPRDEECRSKIHAVFLRLPKDSSPGKFDRMYDSDGRPMIKKPKDYEI